MDRDADTIQHSDGRIELRHYATITASPLYNNDLAPVPIAKRNWTTYNYAALWISMAHCIPTYMLSSGLISEGMNWWQALVTILLGNIIVLIPILLNSHPGTKYGIPFPIYARASYGTYGSNLPALMRAIVACGWFGIQAWIGGEALNVFFRAVIPGWQGLLGGPIGGHMGTEWLSFMLFWALNIYIIYRGMDLLRKVENWAAPFVLVMTALLLGWAIWKAQGLGYLLNQQGKFHSLGEFWPTFIISLTGMIGFWATLSLNMPDFTRFGKSQRDQVIGQVVALPTTMTIFAAMGVMITSAAVVIYPNMKVAEFWDPMKLVGQFHNVCGDCDFDVHSRGGNAGGKYRGQRRFSRKRLCQCVPQMDLISHWRIDTRRHGHIDASMASACRSLGVHLCLVGRLFWRPGIDCRRFDYGLLVCTPEAARAGRLYRTKAFTLTMADGTGALLRQR